MWDFNKPYQAPIEKNHPAASEGLDLKDPAIFDQCLGKDECYVDFLTFFKKEIAVRGRAGRP